ncbi:MAG: Veg family protein [Firmicutes bacterium]|nr:Veg family protein [Bacillota bacterium]
MATQPTTLAEIKKEIEDLIGRRVHIRANPGRRKIVEREGTLEQTYPNHFVIRLDADQQNRRVSYSYADILMEAVQLTPCDNVSASAG